MPRLVVHRVWLAVSAAALVAAGAVAWLTNPWLLLPVVAGPTVALVLAQRGWRASQRLFEEVSAERERLDRLAREGEELVARVSRELRGPLTPIRGFATALVRRGDHVDPEVRRKALEQIAEGAVRMGQLVDDLLVTTHASHDEPERALGLAPLDLIGQVHRELELFRTSHPHRSFDVTVAEGVPQALGDPGAVDQILLALLSNACRYSPTGSPITLHVARGAPGAVRVAVTDRGPGIAPGDQERVFERFERLRRPDDPGGLGLGLYVARRLAEAMDGELALDSYEGDGSTFTLSLPVAQHLAGASDDVLEVRS